MSSKQVSRSRSLAAKVMYAALTILKESGGELRGRDVLEEIGKRVTLDEWALETYEKTGYVRWQSILHFFSIDCIKAGFLVKKSGIWYLTAEGEEALSLGEMGLLDAASEAYRKWKENAEGQEDTEGEEPAQEDQRDQEATIQTMQEVALEGLRQQINQKNPYEFQDLVAALLRGMGYYTPFVAPKGKDGGIDVIAYRDPLGAVSPRVKVQVKHRESTASVGEVRQLMGLLQRDLDIGMFVSTGGFTADSRAIARGAQVHVELIDLDRFVLLWQEFYQKLSDADKKLLPLVPIYFFAPAI